MAGGVGAVVLMAIAWLFPAVRESHLLFLASMFVAAAIVAHPIWMAIHLAVAGAESRDRAARRR